MELSIKEIDKSKFYLIGINLLESVDPERASGILKAMKIHIEESGIQCCVVPFAIKQVDQIVEDWTEFLDEEDLAPPLTVEEAANYSKEFIKKLPDDLVDVDLGSGL